MPITNIRWKQGFGLCEGYDIHLLRGNLHLDLLNELELQKSDGTWEDALVYMGAPGNDVSVRFRPSFKRDAAASSATEYVGFGIRVFVGTGKVVVDPPPVPNPVINNFILHVEATDSSNGSVYKISVRFHLHNRVLSAWLSPSVLTLRPSGAALPETTNTRFSVKAQFDDQTVGDISHHPSIIWRPNSNVAAHGFLKIDAGNGPGTPAIQIEAILPPDLEDFLSPNPPEIKATGHIRFAVAWAADNTIRTEVVQIQGAVPGHVNPEVVPNFLFLCDGYKTEDKPRFEAQVTSLVGLMKTSKITRPFDLLATSMNFFRAFTPSNHHGITVLCEVYPNQNEAGNIITESDGTVKIFTVPDPTEPPATGNWGLMHVIYKVGLPVSSQAGLSINDVRNYWNSIVEAIPQDKISDQTVKKWKNLAKRTMMEETDSMLGLAFGDYPSSEKGSSNNEIGFHPHRNARNPTNPTSYISRELINPMLRQLADIHGNSMTPVWVELPDGTRPNSYKLIFIFSSLKWDRGVNYPRGYIAMNVEDREFIPAKPVAGKPTYEVDLTGKITNDISHDRLIRGCHEVGHSFGLGDEYNEKGNFPQNEEVDLFYGNLQKHSDIEDTVTHRLDGFKIKWRWHRIRKAAVISDAITAMPGNKFRIPLINGHGNIFKDVFNEGKLVVLRKRIFPKPLRRNPETPFMRITDPPQADAIVVEIAAGSPFPFTSANIPDFPKGSIVYLPVPAKEPSASDPFAELIARNILTHIGSRNRALNQDPDNPSFCVPDKNPVQQPVKLTVDLPFCFKNKNRIVGLFTGGSQYDCGIYHPTGSCIMRNSNGEGKEFCAVCRYILVDIIDPFEHSAIDRDYAEIYPQT